MVSFFVTFLPISEALPFGPTHFVVLLMKINKKLKRCGLCFWAPWRSFCVQGAFVLVNTTIWCLLYLFIISVYINMDQEPV